MKIGLNGLGGYTVAERQSRIHTVFHIQDAHVLPVFIDFVKTTDVQ
jgi:hypothetical protein